MKEKEEAEENKCNNSGTEERNGTERSIVDTMSVLIILPQLWLNYLDIQKSGYPDNPIPSE